MATASTSAGFPEQTNASIEPLIPIEEASRLLGRSHWSLRQDVRKGRIQCVRLGRRLLFEGAELRRVIREGRAKR